MLKLEDIFKNLRENISFSKNEKKEMRERLEAYAKFHPVRTEESARLYRQRSYLKSARNLLGGGLTSRASATFFYSFKIFLQKRTMPIILILALMFGGGGVSYAAEGAVPGDALYPIKVGINEEVRDIVALTPEAKADWESRLVERRLEEAEKLAEATGAIPPAAQEIIEEKLEKHIEKLEIHLSRVEEKKNVAGAAEISAKLETTLRAHITVLEKVHERQAQKVAVASAAPAEAGRDADAIAANEALATTKEFSKDRLTMLTEKLAQSAEKIAVRREAHLETLAFADAPDRKEAAENQKNVAEKKIAEFTRIFEENGDGVSDAAKGRLEEGISQMKEAFRRGEEALASEKYGEAFIFFQEAGAMAQKLTIFMRSESKHGVSVSGSAVLVKPLVRPDTAVIGVPKEKPTDNASRKEIAEVLLRKAHVYLEETKALFEKHHGQLPDDIAERIRLNIGNAENLIGEGKRAFDAGEYGAAYLAGQKAINLLSEIQQIIRKYVSSSDDDTVDALVRRAHEAAAGALEKAKQAISASDARDEIIRKAKALYEEAHLAFSQGERAMKAGEPKMAIEFFKKTVRIVEEIVHLLRKANTGVGVIKPLPVESVPKPTPVPTPIVCTKEYMPVCGIVKTNIVCITTPCDNTAEKTFGNKCEARAAGAEVSYDGACKTTTTTPTKTDTSSSVETSAQTAPTTGVVEVKVDTAVKIEATDTTTTKTDETRTATSPTYSY